MRHLVLAAALVPVAACTYTPTPPVGSYDPLIYDANGMVAVAPAPAPPPADCRDVTRDVVIAGQKEQAHATVCRLPNGTWHYSD